MSWKLIKSLWYDWQLNQALKVEKYQKAKYFLKKLEFLEVNLSWSARLYKQKLYTENSLDYYKQETATLKRRLQGIDAQKNFWKTNLEFIDHIRKSFQLIDCDKYKLQVTGINRQVFDDLEIALADFIETEINKIPLKYRETKLQEALDDLLGLKKGIDPTYSYSLSTHVYLLKYFPDNIYCTYLAWFLVYQSGLLPRNLKILDLAAGPGTVIYGLALLLSSIMGFSAPPAIHISYYSLEQQAALQYRGLQFWRSYIESFASPLNAYFRFNTLNIFDYQEYASKLPYNFFNFIVISHCFFYHPQQRQESHQIYRQIFQKNLQPEGSVLLIVQGRKLFNIYDIFPTEDPAEEQMVIEMFLNELGLKLEWYKYLTSTGKRSPMKTDFGKFARENLPSQHHLGNTRQKYLKESFIANYVVDDYVILAKKTC